MSILDDILAQKRVEVGEAKARLPERILRERAASRSDRRSFRSALIHPSLRIIAEIKKASPSRGILLEDFVPSVLAQEYEDGGAAALSVLTDQKYFKGEHAHLNQARSACSLPVLRKDFIVDPYQVYESAAMGADAILLIVKALPESLLVTLYQLAVAEGMDVLVETHTADEIVAANRIGAGIIGINNRDLDTFEVSLDRSIDLRSRIHSGALAVSESGIRTAADVARLDRAGFQAVLVGEGLVTNTNRDEALKRLTARG